MPSHHKRYQEQHVEWTPERVFSSAMEIGPATAEAIRAIMNSKHHPEQGFRACIGVIRFAKTWGKERLESACESAIGLNACSYKYIKLILENGGDQRAPAPQLTLAISHDNVRGSEYYSQSSEVNENVDTSNHGELATLEAERDGSGVGVADANA